MNSFDQEPEDAPRRLAAFTVRRPGFRLMAASPRHVHIGALLADGALQAGLNYRTVVFPRVSRIENMFPRAAVMSGLIDVLDDVGVCDFLNWKHPEKVARFESLVELFKRRIEDVEQFASCISQSEVRAELLRINGVGSKTVDYLHRLAGGTEVAVDRHVIRFIEAAGIPHVNYASTKRVVSSAADLLGVSRNAFDASIWTYMSRKRVAAI